MRGARLSALVLLVASSYFGAIDAFCSQSTVFLQGTWSGTITDAGLGTGTLTISIGQKKKTLNGGWSASFEGSGFSGNLKGQTKGTLVVVKLASSQFKKGSCGLKFAGMVAADKIQGNYTWAGCGSEFKKGSGGSISVATST